MEIPETMKRFPMYRGKFPVFYTVSRDQNGRPDFGTLDRGRQIECSVKNLCHLCGRRMSPPYWFVVGPVEYDAKMVSSNGPMHEGCARYAIAACPFLNNPEYVSSRDPFASADEWMRANMEKHGIHGKNVRPDRLALCSANEYRSRLDVQIPEWYVRGWETTDWGAAPQRVAAVPAVEGTF